MEFDAYAKQYDDNFMGKGSKRFYRDLLKEMEIAEEDSVLDVGCGTGLILSHIGEQRKIHGFGLDVSEAMIAVAKEKHPEYDFLVGDCAKLPYDDASMDIVTACMAYHHFPNQEGFRKEVLRVLKPGGRFYLCDPRFPWIVRGFFNTFFKDSGFRTVRRNEKDFEQTGFRHIRSVKDFYVQVISFEK